jgi:hypothetical protein
MSNARTWSNFVPNDFLTFFCWIFQTFFEVLLSQHFGGRLWLRVFQYLACGFSARRQRSTRTQRLEVEVVSGFRASLHRSALVRAAWAQRGAAVTQMALPSTHDCEMWNRGILTALVAWNSLCPFFTNYSYGPMRCRVFPLAFCRYLFLGAVSISSARISRVW